MLSSLSSWDGPWGFAASEFIVVFMVGMSVRVWVSSLDSLLYRSLRKKARMEKPI